MSICCVCYANFDLCTSQSVVSNCESRNPNHCICNDCFKEALKSGTNQAVHLMCMVPDCEESVTLSFPAQQTYKKFHLESIERQKEIVEFERDQSAKIISSVREDILKEYDTTDQAHFTSTVAEKTCLRCPRCKCAFEDFDGCLALTCGNIECNASFCAVCLKDCGTDAHQHLTDVHKTEYFNKALFEESKRQRAEVIAEESLEPYIKTLEDRSILASKITGVDLVWLCIKINPIQPQLDYFRKENDKYRQKYDEIDNKFQHMMVEYKRLTKSELNLLERISDFKTDYNRDQKLIRDARDENIILCEKIKKIEEANILLSKQIIEIQHQQVDEITSLKK